MKHVHWIMGKNTLKEAFKVDPSRFLEIITHQDVNAPFMQPFIQAGIKVSSVNKAVMEKKLASASHGGVAARLKQKEPWSLQELIEELERKEKGLIVVLDGIVDPHNVGAILRSCECFGADAVIWSKNRGPDITPTVTKVSVGASEILPLCVVSNLHDALLKLKEAYFSIITAEKKEKSYTPDQLPSFDRKVLVMGSEEKGVRPLISKIADASIFIPMQGHIDSLNVSAAAAVLLSHMSLR